MKKRFLSMLLAAMAVGAASQLSAAPAAADASNDIHLDLTSLTAKAGNGGLLDADELTSNVQFGIANQDGVSVRVAVDDPTAVAVISGKYHSEEHGLVNFSADVKVLGPAKIIFGTCAWGGDVTVKTAEGELLSTFNTNTGACYHQNHDNVVYTYYKGEAATLTIAGGAYVPYFAVEAVDEVPNDVVFTFEADADVEGEAPAAVTVDFAAAFTLPLNRTLFVEGKTLTGWTDGTNTYAPGQTILAEASTTLKAVFTANTQQLGDRETPVTVLFDFQRQNGAPTLAYEGRPGIYVAQAEVNGQTIDVVTRFTTSPGKVANGNWTDWCQMNGGTTFTIPSCKGAVVSIESYSATTTTTIDGQTDYTANGNVVTYTVGNTASEIDIVIGDGSYFRYFKIELPVVEGSNAGMEFADEATSLYWAFDTNSQAPAVVTPKAGFTLTAVSVGESLTEQAPQTPSASDNKGIPFVTFLSPSSAGAQTEGYHVEWVTKPAKGLTFTPTRVSGRMARFGTDGGTIDIVLENGEGQRVVLAEGLIPARNNNEKEADKHGNDPKYTTKFELDVPAELATASGLSLKFYVAGLNNKSCGFAQIQIEGTLNGVIAEVAKYTFDAVASPEEGGTVNVYPAGGTYDEGTELQLTATENFGYDFVNWTDAEGAVVSDQPKFKFELTGDAVYTANFVKVNTYELKLAVDAAANDYMVQPSPAPTPVNGKMMYEAGTEVTLTAASNAILTFTNWTTGETAGETKVVMDGDVEIGAVYSAIDYIVGWDFYRSGANGRPADFASTSDNEAAVLVLRNAAGEQIGWLDKSTLAAGGYESFAGAAVNWKKLGEYYFQTKVNAKDFENITVQAKMMYNYNAYTTQVLEYSLDNEAWTEVTRITMAGTKTENEIKGTLPAAANHAETLYLRWRPDLDGAVDGTNAPDNDGTAIADIYIIADQSVYDDGKAPVLASSVPADGATGASATGKIVLNFDKKVQLLEGAQAILGKADGTEQATLTGAVSGKTVTFPYVGLAYSTAYKFELKGGSVADLAGNVLTDGLSFGFTTMDHPTVTPGQYDRIVTTADELLAALADGKDAATTGVRFRIFLHDGTYDLGNKCLTAVTGNISLIGESEEGTVIVNHPEAEGIGVTATLQVTGSNVYMQDLTLKNAWDYTGTTGRAVCLQDRGNKNVYKNVRQLSYQDTYYSNNNSGRFYFEGGEIHGTVDFLCGGGDVFFNEVLLFVEDRSGNCITAPATSTDWGYVFNNCTIDGEGAANGTYSLGRPWQGAPRAVYLNTTMKVIPQSAGWASMGTFPALFAEWNSHTESGAPVDMSGRTTTFTANGVTQTMSYSPVLTDEEAARFTLENVLGGTDNWQPNLLTEQAPVAQVTVVDGNLVWDETPYAFCYAVLKNGKVVAFTNEAKYAIPADATETDAFSVRTANEMGGLGAASNALTKDGVSSIETIKASSATSGVIYDLSGRRVENVRQGALYVIDGHKVMAK